MSKMDRNYENGLQIEEEKFTRRDGTEGVAYHFVVSDGCIKHNIIDKDGNELRFRNFEGVGGDWNHEGDRSFMWEFDDPELADELRNKWGLNIKTYVDKNGIQTWSLKIRVKYRGSWNDPKIWIDSDTAPRCEIPEDCLGDLDVMFFERSDFTFTLYNYKKNGKTGVSAYLEEALIYKKPAKTRRSFLANRKFGTYTDEEE